jgi:hypothetical protein
VTAMYRGDRSRSGWSISSQRDAGSGATERRGDCENGSASDCGCPGQVNTPLKLVSQGSHTIR